MSVHAFAFEIRGQVWCLSWLPEKGFYMWPTCFEGDLLTKLVAMYKDPAKSWNTWIYMDAPHPSDAELAAASDPMMGRETRDIRVRALLAKHCSPVLRVLGITT